MKTFKQLREKWLASYKGAWQKDQNIDIFKNPTRKEIVESEKKGYHGFRGIISPNDDLYVWGTEFHTTILKKLPFNQRKFAIPIRGKISGQSLTVFVSPTIDLGKWNWYDANDNKNIRELIVNQTQLKRHFSNIIIKKELEG